MNPLRVLLLSLSRIPPAVLLCTIVALAGTAALVISNQMDTNKKAVEAAQAAMDIRINEKGKVVFAIKDIPEGQTISSDAIEERQIPKTQIPPDALGASTLAAGRLAKYGIIANQIVSQHDLALQSATQGFEAQLKAGQRAITFGVDNNSGVAGFIVPQSHIDILATVGGAGETKVAPVLSDVKVIAVGPTYQRVPGSSNTPASNVTVAVDPDEAKKLVKAIVASKLYVTLRNENDHTPLATVDVTSLFAKPVAAREISLAEAATQLPPPPINDAISLDKTAGIIPAAEAPRVNREIEMWSGSKKDMLPVPNS